VVDDPADIIAIARLIDELVGRGQYKDATKLVSALKEANRSGVGYSAFPSVILAFAMTDDEEKALEHISELRAVVTTEVLQRSGYLSRAEQISWIWTSLKAVESKLMPGKVQTNTTALALELHEIITDLGEPKAKARSIAMKEVLPKWTNLALDQKRTDAVEGFNWSRLQISGLIETWSTRGKYDKAIELFEKHQAILRNAPFLTYEPHVAIAYEMSGKTDAAVNLLSRIRHLFLQAMQRGRDASYMKYTLTELEKSVSDIDDSREPFKQEFARLVQELAAELGHADRQ